MIVLNASILFFEDHRGNHNNCAHVQKSKSGETCFCVGKGWSAAEVQTAGKKELISRVLNDEHIERVKVNHIFMQCCYFLLFWALHCSLYFIFLFCIVIDGKLTFMIRAG